MARPTPKTRTPKSAAKPEIDNDPIVKGDDDGDMDDDEDDDEDEEKSDLDADTLVKAMDDLEEAGKQAQSGLTPRAAALARKLAETGKLSKAEHEELRSLTSDDEPVTTREEMRKSEAIAEGVDASDFLDALVTKFGGAVDGLKAEMRKSAENTDTFNAQLAKSFAAMGRGVAGLIKENAGLRADVELLKSELGIVAQQPRQPKGSTKAAKAAERPGLEKGGDNDEPTLSPEVISDTLDEMLTKGEFPQGVDALVEISKYESTGILRADVMAKVAAKHGIELPAQTDD